MVYRTHLPPPDPDEDVPADVPPGPSEPPPGPDPVAPPGEPDPAGPPIKEPPVRFVANVINGLNVGCPKKAINGQIVFPGNGPFFREGGRRTIALCSLIFWRIDGIFCVLLVLRWRPEFSTRLASLPRSLVSITEVRVTQAESLVLILTTSATTKRDIFGIAANPLIATARFNQRGFLVATKATTLSGNGNCLQSIVCHGLPRIKR